MRNLLFILLALGLGGCATTPSRPPAQATRPEPTPQATAVPRPSPAPTPQPTPTAVPTVPPPAMAPTDDFQEPLIRVLLRRTSETITLPQPGRAWRLTTGKNALWLWGPLNVSNREGPGWYQVGAFGGDQTALEAGRTLKRIFGDAIDVKSLSEDGGLNRVRVHWTSAEPADPRTSLAEAGFPGAFWVSTSGKVRVEGQGGAVVSEGEILLEPAGDFPAVVGARRYRGRFRVRPSGVDQVLLINELNLERYLLGVVPAEMGPSVFPEVEALKAQAVAARTYAVAHLGDHEDEGYDICDTPACQVYAGADAEHSLSTRAIRETTGLVAVFDGRPIDAMYTSTCGGHTETSSELFSGRAQPYLQAVPCAWDRDLQLVGGGVDGPWRTSTDFGAAVARHVLGLNSGASHETIVRAVSRAVGTAVGARPLEVRPAPPLRLKIANETQSVVPEILEEERLRLRPSEVTFRTSSQLPLHGGGAAGSLADPEAFSRALLEAGGLTRSAEILSPDNSALDGLLFLADLYKVPLDPPVDGLESSWLAAAALAVLELRGIVVRDRGEAVPRPDGVGIFPRRAEASETLPATVPLWERWRGSFRQRAGQTVRPGVELERLRRGDQVVALVVRHSGGFGEADRRSAWREWVREKPWSELAGRLGVPDLEKLEITRRTDFGRVVGLAAVGRSGRRKEWTGFDVRRALDLPETLFTVDVLTRPDGVKVARFLGRGWGHGVGLCQNGAYGLARSGMTFDRILSHYYSGIQLVRW